MCGQLCICFPCQSCREPLRMMWMGTHALELKLHDAATKHHAHAHGGIWGRRRILAALDVGKEHFNDQHVNDFHTLCGS